MVGLRAADDGIVGRVGCVYRFAGQPRISRNADLLRVVRDHDPAGTVRLASSRLALAARCAIPDLWRLDWVPRRGWPDASVPRRQDRSGVSHFSGDFALAAGHRGPVAGIAARAYRQAWNARYRPGFVLAASIRLR